MNIKKNGILLAIILICFIVDVSAIIILHNPIFLFSICFFCILLSSPFLFYVPITTGFFLVSTLFFMWYGSFLLFFPVAMILVPLSVLLRNRLVTTGIIPSFLLLIGIIIQKVLVEGRILHFPHIFFSTIGFFCVNLFILILLQTLTSRIFKEKALR